MSSTAVGIALTLACLAVAGLFWCACILASAADALEDARDEHADWLGLGSDSFPHDRDNTQ